MTLQQTEYTVQNSHGKVPFIQLFKLASISDVILMIVGSIASVIGGAAQPVFGLLFGEITQKFQKGNVDEIVDSCGKLALQFIEIGALTFLMSIVMMFCWISVGEQIGIKLRIEYFKSLVRQDVAYFDKINASEVASKFAADCYKVQSAMGEKVAIFIYIMSMFIGSIIISFLRGWQMALIACSITPVIAGIGYFYQWVVQSITSKTAKAYSSAGGIAEEAISAIRTVKSLNGENHEHKRYTSFIGQAFKVAAKFSIYTGMGLGLQNMMFFLDFAITFWAGSKFIEDQTYNHSMGRVYEFSDVITVVLAIMISSFELGQGMNSIKAFAHAQIAGFNIFEVIDRKPEIISDKGKILDNFQGSIIFDKVSFAYNAAPNSMVLKGIELNIRPHIKTAIVGESGSGKSTIIQLIERFYDPTSGSIQICGHPLSSLSLQSLRSKIGYVGQEPVLFATSIRENLLYGKTDATEEDMIFALKQANAWQFIERLEKGLDTFVGQQGTQFSGGQKQRISIARALLKNPEILLLDEATSALDRVNEVQIQRTLDQVSSGRTTVVVAHRLSTIQNSDEIIVIDQGVVAERGTHDTLMQQNGRYYQFVIKQQTIEEKEQSLEDQVKEVARIDSNILQTKSTLIDNQIIHTSNQDEINQMITLQVDQKEMEESTNKYPRLQIFDNEDHFVKPSIPQGLPIEAKSKTYTKEQYSQVTKRLMKQALKADKSSWIIGCLFSAGHGLCFPFSGWAIGNLANVLLNKNREDFRSESDKLTFVFIAIAAFELITSTLQCGFFSRVAEKITYELRQKLFAKILRLPISWFDQEKNSVGSMTSKLSSDCAVLNTITTQTFGLEIANFSSLISALALAFSADWRTTLVGLCMMPIMIMSQMWYMSRQAGFGEKTDQSYRDTTNLINDCSCNIRTVTSFGNTSQIVLHFEQLLNQNLAIIKKQAFGAAIAFGFTNFTLFAIYGTIFYSGAVFHRDNGVEIVDIFISIQCLMFASIGIGCNSFVMGDVGAAKGAAVKVFEIIDHPDELCDIQFIDVSFKYPSRDHYVLKNFNVHIPAGRKVAFVGASGAGKSSVIQLLLRFYNTYSGKILLDGNDIKSYDLHAYRNIFGLVSQEPTLFQGSIKDNIQYNQDQVQLQDIVDIVKQTNAYDFIFQQSSGLDREVGLKGNKLSGGQKQRIAISRAMLRKPQIMLLDEATSALDSQNERIVQQSLDATMVNRTSICIAHRLSTIQDSDLICVMEHGKIIEEGRYQELLDSQTAFYKLSLGQQ